MDDKITKEELDKMLEDSKAQFHRMISKKIGIIEDHLRETKIFEQLIRMTNDRSKEILEKEEDLENKARLEKQQICDGFILRMFEEDVKDSQKTIDFLKQLQEEFETKMMEK